MKAKLLGMIAAISMVLLVMTPAVANADSTCYTACTQSVSSGHGSSAPPAAKPTSTSSTGGGGGLPFTGADIGAMAAVGFIALGAGLVLVYRSRRVASEV